MTNTDIVTKLIGNIVPIGETHIDDERFENLKEMCELVDDLLDQINTISSFANSREFSIKRAAKYANNFLTKTIDFQ